MNEKAENPSVLKCLMESYNIGLRQLSRISKIPHTTLYNYVELGFTPKPKYAVILGIIFNVAPHVFIFPAGKRFLTDKEFKNLEKRISLMM